jgi:hypothetical protein
MEALRLTNDSLRVVALFAAALRPDHTRLQEACAAELFAADRAYELAAQGMPFRDAYRAVAANPTAQEPGDLAQRLRARTAAGATGALDLDGLDARIAGERAIWRARARRLATTLGALATGALPAPDDAGSADEAIPHGAHASAHAPVTPAIALGI